MADTRNQQRDRCPVCAMEVNDSAFNTEYLGMRFVFCSQQCEERFLANPHLYIGQPGEPAPAQQGRVVLKRRRIQLAQPLAPEQEWILVPLLCAMMGVREAKLNAERTVVDVTYDLIQATEQQIEAQLMQAGAQLGDGWAKRLRRGFVHYLEETEVENLEVGPDAHEHRH